MLRAAIFITCLIYAANGFAQGSMQYPLAAFNNDTCCWRKLSGQGKYIDAAELVVAYKHHNKDQGKQALNWHAGQLYAMGGDKKHAKQYFKKTYSVFYKWFGGSDGATWYYFAKGTGAFVAGDKKKLNRIIHKWQRRYKQDGNYKELVTLYGN